MILCFGTEFFGDVGIVEYEGGFYNGKRCGYGKLYTKENELKCEGEWYMNSEHPQSNVVLFNEINEEGQTILMVTHSTRAASHAKRVLFIKDGEVFHQLYRGNMSNEELFVKISDTLTVLTADAV